jgi:hypothetical protein
MGEAMLNRQIVVERPEPRNLPAAGSVRFCLILKIRTISALHVLRKRKLLRASSLHHTHVEDVMKYLWGLIVVSLLASGCGVPNPDGTGAGGAGTTRTSSPTPGSGTGADPGAGGAGTSERGGGTGTGGTGATP